MLASSSIGFFARYFRRTHSTSIELMGRSPGEIWLRSHSTKNPTQITAMKGKYCSLVQAAFSFTRRATFPVLFVTAALVLNTTARAQAPPGSLWYNGDSNFV